MEHWVGVAFGAMETVLTDNGCELSSDEMREVASILNIINVKVCTTSAESPYQNAKAVRKNPFSN